MGWWYYCTVCKYLNLVCCTDTGCTKCKPILPVSAHCQSKGVPQLELERSQAISASKKLCVFSQVCKIVPGSVRLKSSVNERPGCSGASLSLSQQQHSGKKQPVMEQFLDKRPAMAEINQAQEYLTLSLITGEWNMLFLTQAAAYSKLFFLPSRKCAMEFLE